VTTRRFVRMQTERHALTVATPDLPLWKFGGMFFAHTSQLDPAARRPAMLAWLANNYWEVNFLANQTGETRYRFRLLAHAPESVDQSMARALPFTFPPRIHAYREMGPVQRTEDTLLAMTGEGVSLESVTRRDDGVLLTLMNLRAADASVALAPAALRWREAYHARLDGTRLDRLSANPDGGWEITLPSRGLGAVLLVTE
jgi:hypothetical protein